MSSTVPTVPSKKPATKPADDANNAPATDPAVTNPRNDFDALAGVHVPLDALAGVQMLDDPPVSDALTVAEAVSAPANAAAAPGSTRAPVTVAEPLSEALSRIAVESAPVTIALVDTLDASAARAYEPPLTSVPPPESLGAAVNIATCSTAGAVNDTPRKM
jgi:hypothetical protein